MHFDNGQFEAWNKKREEALGTRQFEAWFKNREEALDNRQFDSWFKNRQEDWITNSLRHGTRIQ